MNHTHIENLYSFDCSDRKKLSRDNCTDDNYGNEGDNDKYKDSNNDNNDSNDVNDDDTLFRRQFCSI